MWKFICVFLLCVGLSVDVSGQDDKENARRILESLNSLDDSKATREYNAWRSKYKHFRSRPSFNSSLSSFAYKAKNSNE